MEENHFTHLLHPYQGKVSQTAHRDSPAPNHTRGWDPLTLSNSSSLGMYCGHRSSNQSKGWWQSYQGRKPATLQRDSSPGLAIKNASICPVLSCSQTLRIELRSHWTWMTWHVHTKLSYDEEVVELVKYSAVLKCQRVVSNMLDKHMSSAISQVTSLTQLAEKKP